MKRLLLFLMIILFVNVVSASYTCSSGPIVKEKSVINIGQIDVINGVEIALFDSSRAISADILIDADNVVLTNQSSSVEVELLSGNYDIKLMNLTVDSVGLRVEGDKKEIEKEKVELIGGLQIYVLSLEGKYPESDASAEFFVGVDYLFLHNTDPKTIKTINGTEYLFELSSSSDEGAIINVEKCESGTLVEVVDPVEEVLNNSIIDNSSLQNESSASIENTTITENFTGSENLQAIDEDSTQNIISNFLIQNLFYVLTGFFVICILVIIFLIIKNKKYDEESGG